MGIIFISVFNTSAVCLGFGVEWHLVNYKPILAAPSLHLNYWVEKKGQPFYKHSYFLFTRLLLTSNKFNYL